MSKTIFESYNECKRELMSAGIEDYVFEAKQIIKHITGYTNAQILVKYSQPLTQFQQNNLTAIIKQRKCRYPLQYIFGKWNFFGRDFFVGPGVLIPRSDTETLMDVCLEYLKSDSEYKVLDLCAGTGCIGITIAAEREKAQVTMLEKYEEALTYTRKNAEANGVSAEIIKGDVLLGDKAEDKYDLIVSNPPYIDKNDMARLQPEVQFEPETALTGGADGLDFYRAIINNYKNSLSPDGMMAFEVGINQSQAVASLMETAGFKNIGTREDMNGIKRVVFGTLN